MFFESTSPEVVSALGKAGAAFAICFAAMGSAAGTGMAGMAAVVAWKKCYAQKKMAPFMLVAFVGAPLRKISIFGKETVTRMNRVGTGFFGRLDYPVVYEIALCRR